MSRVIYQKRSIISANPGFFMVEKTWDGKNVVSVRAVADVPVIGWSLHLKVFDDNSEITEVTPIIPVVAELPDTDTPILTPTGIVLGTGCTWDSLDAYGSHLQEIEDEKSKFRSFLLSNFELENSSMMPRDEVFSTYVFWCRESGFEPSFANLCRHLDTFDISTIKIGGERFFSGIRKLTTRTNSDSP